MLLFYKTTVWRLLTFTLLAIFQHKALKLGFWGFGVLGFWGFGIAHGLICLPVMLSIFGPKAFASAEKLDESDNSDNEKQIGSTAHDLSANDKLEKVSNEDEA